MPRIIHPVAMDIGAVKGAAFQSFDVHRQVPVKQSSGVYKLEQRSETVDSVHKLRQIERDSEQRYVNGEGEPLRFRAWNNERSNTDVSGFGTEGVVGSGSTARAYDSGLTPQKKPNISTKRHGQKKPRIATARHAGQSALKDR